jgi:hypothetical protein
LKSEILVLAVNSSVFSHRLAAGHPTAQKGPVRAVLLHEQVSFHFHSEFVRSRLAHAMSKSTDPKASISACADTAANPKQIDTYLL